ncbi:MAG: hypothetical protein Q9221_008993 [Calogaya cf. arnoldii]
MCFKWSEISRALKEFVRIRCLVDYGDYLPDDLPLKAQAKANIGGSIEQLTGLEWTQVHKQLETEDDRRNQARLYQIPPSYDYIRPNLTFYFSQNMLCHSTVHYKLTKCDWKALGAQLYDDRMQIPFFFEKEKQRHMNAALDRVAKEYFIEISSLASKPSILAMKKELELLDRERRKIRKRIAAQEQEVNVARKKESFERKKERVADRLEREKEEKKEARASRDRTDSWTEDDDDFGVCGLFEG